MAVDQSSTSNIEPADSSQPGAEPEHPISVRCSARRLPRRGWSRVLSALSLWTFISSFAELIAQVLLAHRQRAELEQQDGRIRLRVTRWLLGRPLGVTEISFAPHGFKSVTIRTGGADPRFATGLAALTLGTYFGTGLFVEAFHAPGTSLSLLGLALVLVAAGTLLDFTLSRNPAKANSASIELRPESGRGWMLIGVDEAAARACFDV